MRAHRRVLRGRCDEGEADQRQREIHAERQQEKPLHRRGRIAFAHQTPAGQRHAGEGGREARSHCAQRRYSGERAQSPTPVAAIGSPREGEVGEPEQHQQLKRRQETPLRSLPRERERRADRGDHQHERQSPARQTSPEERGHGQRRQRGKHRVQRQLGAGVPLTVEISESDCQQPGPHRAVLVAGPPEPRPDRATRPVRAEHVDGLGVPLVVKRQVSPKRPTTVQRAPTMSRNAPANAAAIHHRSRCGVQSAGAGGASVMAAVGMRSGSPQRQALPAGPVGSLVPRRSGARAEDEFAVAEAAHVEVERKQAAVVERGGGEKRPPEKLAHLVARAPQDNDISAVGRVVTGVGAFLDAEGPGRAG